MSIHAKRKSQQTHTLTPSTLSLLSSGNRYPKTEREGINIAAAPSSPQQKRWRPESVGFANFPKKKISHKEIREKNVFFQSKLRFQFGELCTHLRVRGRHMCQTETLEVQLLVSPPPPPPPWFTAKKHSREGGRWGATINFSKPGKPVHPYLTKSQNKMKGRGKTPLMTKRGILEASAKKTFPSHPPLVYSPQIGQERSRALFLLPPPFFSFRFGKTVLWRRANLIYMDGEKRAGRESSCWD